jgi:hypothetical protein
VKGKTFALRYPGRPADDCASCHEDPHKGQFEKDRSCIDCHDRQRFDPHAFTVEKHTGTSLPLTGRHVEIECKECHLVHGEGEPRLFRGTPAACGGCHDDAHRGFFARFTVDRGDGGDGQCAECHLTTTFAEVPASSFDHHHHAGFAVLGAHAQEACESCHPRSEKPDEFGRRFGLVAEHFGIFKGCVTCHVDPHRGEFDKRGRPRKIRGRTGCARCHVQTSFRALPKGFDHGKWTGFALNGVHKEIDCSGCHAPLRDPDDSGRTWKHARGRKCADCHSDPHAGQFKQKGVTSCERCHRSAMSFSDLSFRHDLDSRFRLGKAHEGLACSACHEPVRQGGAAVVRYRPLEGKCSACHESIDDPFRRGTRRGPR